MTHLPLRQHAPLLRPHNDIQHDIAGAVFIEIESPLRGALARRNTELWCAPPALTLKLSFAVPWGSRPGAAKDKATKTLGVKPGSKIPDVASRASSDQRTATKNRAGGSWGGRRRANGAFFRRALVGRVARGAFTQRLTMSKSSACYLLSIEKHERSAFCLLPVDGVRCRRLCRSVLIMPPSNLPPARHAGSGAPRTIDGCSAACPCGCNGHHQPFRALRCSCIFRAASWPTR